MSLSTDSSVIKVRTGPVTGNKIYPYTLGQTSDSVFETGKLMPSTHKQKRADGWQREQVHRSSDPAGMKSSNPIKSNKITDKEIPATASRVPTRNLMLKRNKNMSCLCMDGRPKVLFGKQGDLPRIWCWSRRWNTWCSSSLHEPWNAFRTSFGWIFVFNAARSLLGKSHIYGPLCLTALLLEGPFFFNFPKLDKRRQLFQCIILNIMLCLGKEEVQMEAQRCA